MKLLEVKTRPNSKKRLEKTNIYIWPKGENVIQNLMYRRQRPTELWRKFLPEIYKQLGWDQSTQALWSQKAGCSCGCSPGFKTNHMSFDDVHVIIGVDDDVPTSSDSGGQRGENPTVQTESNRT